MTVRTASLTRDPKSGNWKARKALPADVRDAYAALYGPRHEAKFSAPKALTAADAKAAFAEWHAETETRIKALRDKAAGRGSDLTQRQAQALAGGWYNWFVGAREENPGTREQWEAEAAKLREASAALESIGAAIRNAGIAKLGFSRARVANDNWMKDQTALQAVMHGSPLLRVDNFLIEQNEQLSAAGYEALFNAMERRVGEAFKRLAALSDGDYSEDKVVAQFPRRMKAAGLRPSELFKEYVIATKPAPNTVIRWRNIFEQLDRFFPDRDAGSLTDDDAHSWREDLRKRLSDKSVNEQYVAGAKVVFNWALNERKLSRNPFASLKAGKTKRAPKERERSFRDAELQTILKASLAPPPPRMKMHALARRWVPWLCIYTGARPGEICQMRKEDLVQVSGHWAIRLTPEAGTIKDREARTIPLHPHLVEQGFVDFVHKQPKGPLFYDPALLRKGNADPTDPRRHPAEKVRMRLGEWVREIGVNDPNISPMHAFRNTWKNNALHAGIDKVVRDFVQGHAPETVGDQYNQLEGEKGFAILLRELAKYPRIEIAKALTA